MRPLIINKECAKCHKKHTYIPAKARKWLDDEVIVDQKPLLLGFFWECSGIDEKGETCNSTLFERVDKKRAA